MLACIMACPKNIFPCFCFLLHLWQTILFGGSNQPFLDLDDGRIYRSTKLETLPVKLFPNKQIQGYVDSAFVIMFTLELLIRVTLEKLYFFRGLRQLVRCLFCTFRALPHYDWWLGTRAITIPYVIVCVHYVGVQYVYIYIYHVYTCLYVR